MERVKQGDLQLNAFVAQNKSIPVLMQLGTIYEWVKQFAAARPAAQSGDLQPLTRARQSAHRGRARSTAASTSNAPDATRYPVPVLIDHATAFRPVEYSGPSLSPALAQLQLPAAAWR